MHPSLSRTTATQCSMRLLSMRYGRAAGGDIVAAQSRTFPSFRARLCSSVLASYDGIATQLSSVHKMTGRNESVLS